MPRDHADAKILVPGPQALAKALMVNTGLKKLNLSRTFRERSWDAVNVRLMQAGVDWGLMSRA